MSNYMNVLEIWAFWGSKIARHPRKKRGRRVAHEQRVQVERSAGAAVHGGGKAVQARGESGFFFHGFRIVFFDEKVKIPRRFLDVDSQNAPNNIRAHIIWNLS